MKPDCTAVAEEIGDAQAAQIMNTLADYEEAKAYLNTCNIPVVLKADGLAAGKGVIIPQTMEDAHTALKDMMCDGLFDKAGSGISAGAAMGTNGTADVADPVLAGFPQSVAFLGILFHRNIAQSGVA